MAQTKIFVFYMLLLTITCKTYADNNYIPLEFSNMEIKNDIYILDAVFNLVLQQKPLDALHHGVPLEVQILLNLELKRDWLWNKSIYEEKIIYRLNYQPLTENYLIINLTNGLRDSNNNLELMLKKISSISKLGLFNKSILEKNKDYLLRFKIKLNTKSLPVPIRSLLYFYDEWDMQSIWHEISI